MGTHPAGDGVSWDDIEAIDSDQPHGLDWRAITHLAKAVRKRADKEHKALGDTTAGLEHDPGKCGVCLVCDDTADFTALVDATTAPLGAIAYCISYANLWCMTKTASSGSPDVTVMKFGPQSFCLGADYTWTGALEIDGSIDFSSPTWFDDSVDVQGLLFCASSLAVDGSSDFSDVFSAGDLSIAGTLKVATDLTITGDLGIDGTSNFFDEVDFSDVQFDASVSVGSNAVFSILSAYTNQDSDGNTLLKAHVYQTQTDGELSAYITITTGQGDFYGYVGDTTDPQGAGNLVRHESDDTVNMEVGFSFMVAKGEYFIIVGSQTGAATIFWKSFGALGKPIDKD